MLQTLKICSAACRKRAMRSNRANIFRRAPGQERFTRLKTLGVDYTEEALAARIAGFSRPSRQPKQQNGKISLLIFTTSSGVGKS